MINTFNVFMPESVKEPLLKTLFSGYIGQGEIVDSFEKAFSKKFGIRNVISVNSGTSALRLSLALIGVGPGDEVISTPYTMVATNMVILEQFAKPIFADIKYESVNIDPSDIEHRINDRTKAIICVHWGGYPCDLDELHKIASDNDIPIIEDAAHALGASYKNKPIGTISDYTAFSFQAIKHLTTGDGGILSINNNNTKIKEALRRRWFGIDRAHRKKDFIKDPVDDITEVGYKYHMNNIAATIGLEQLKYVNSNFKRRTEMVKVLREELSSNEILTLLEKRKDRISANWMFAVLVKNRTKFIKFLQSKGIAASIHNWRNDRYSIFGGKRKDLPNLEKVNERLVNLPFYTGMLDKDLNKIIKEIKNYTRG